MNQFDQQDFKSSLDFGVICDLNIFTLYFEIYFDNLNPLSHSCSQELARIYNNLQNLWNL